MRDAVDGLRAPFGGQAPGYAPETRHPEGAAGRPAGCQTAEQKVHAMIVLGIILLIIGFVAAIPILWTIGIIVLLIGLVLAIAGFAGRELAGRRHWY